MRLQMLVTILEGLCLGLRGKRRSALKVALSEMRAEVEDVEDLTGRIRDEASRAWDLASQREVELGDREEELRTARSRVSELEEALQAAHTAGPPAKDDGEWGVWVRRRVLVSHKILCIKAVRMATSMGLGLLEAKHMVEAGGQDLMTQPTGPEDWFCLSQYLDARELGRMLDTLLLRHENALHLETDVKFEKTREPVYY